MGHDLDIIELFRNIATNSNNVRFSNHANEEMLKDDLTNTQVIEVILKGIVVEGPYQERKNWKANFKKLVAGDLITVVAALNESNTKITVVTAWLNKR